MKNQCVRTYEVAGMKFKVALISLAVVCLLMAPALSMPSGKGDNGGYRGCADGKNPLLGNLTREQLDNMTLKQFKDLQSNASCNRTGCPLEMAGSSQPNGQLGANPGPNGGHGMNGFGMDRRYGPADGASGSDMLLLMGDLKADKLRNMTINQILELKKTKMQQMDNMTPDQINELRHKKLDEVNNMTLSQINAARNESREVASILDMVGMKRGAPEHNARTWIPQRPEQ
ncbi:Uncharacterised protein [uncultured archaeon]|nr:Uncharacterised protein [uncultured archaeon]